MSDEWVLLLVAVVVVAVIAYGLFRLVRTAVRRGVEDADRSG